MTRRYHDAIGIQQGACNPSGIARSLVQAIDECRAEGGSARQDPAVALILHQLVFVAVGHDFALGSAWEGWDAAMRLCEERCAAAKALSLAGQGVPA